MCLMDMPFTHSHCAWSVVTSPFSVGMSLFLQASVFSLFLLLFTFASF